MSSHRRRVKHFHRASGPRKALLKGLVESLVEHGRIKTTIDKAKELRRHVEKAVTLGKKGDLATRRLLLSRYPSELVVQMIMTNLAPRFKSRPGGYTRIIKLGRRPGDNAEMAFIEFVDYKYTDKPVVKVDASEGDENAETGTTKKARSSAKGKTKTVVKAKQAKAAGTSDKKSEAKVKSKSESSKKPVAAKKGAKVKTVKTSPSKV